ncbi:MAG: hypothetical protein IJO32_01480 [Bacilli bacterium]|nr:hypothetical protein [Bacilli bacterium]
MATSIFDIEVRLDINKEFNKMVKYLHHTSNTTYTKIYGSTFIEAINYYAIKVWPYRGTAITCEEYLENIGISSYYFKDGMGIDKIKFLYYLEFIYNIYKFASYRGLIKIESESVKAIIKNLNLIVEQMNYEFVKKEDKYLLVKRNADIDSILTLVEKDIAELLLEYNDFKIKDNLQRKSEILKSIDKYIEKNQSEYSKIDKDSYKSWGYIVNNFGVNHKTNEKYKDEDENNLIKWYDKAFMLSIHLIRLTKIKEINNERKSLES